MKNRIMKKSIAFLMAFAMIVTGLEGFASSVEVKAAVYDYSDCLTFETFNSMTTIPDGTLFIGTYLIDIDAMNDQLYSLAEESASASSQTGIYYKSELGGGQWYDIADAGDIAAISTEGTIASEDDLADLYVKFYVDEDGIVHKCVGGSVDSIFDDKEPYDLWSMEEFSDLTLLYTNEGNSYLTCCTDINRDWAYHACLDLLNSDHTDDYTDERDAELANLYSVETTFLSWWKDGLWDGIDDERVMVLYEIMESIDAERRVEYLNNILDDTGDTGFEQAYEAISDPTGQNPTYPCSNARKASRTVDEDGDVTYSYTPSADYTVVSALATVQSNIYESISDYEAKIISKPTGDSVPIVSKMKYNLYVDIRSYAAEDTIWDHTQDIFDYCDYSHIEKGVVADYDSELEKLDDTLTPQALSRYRRYLIKGANSTYTAQKEAGASESDLESLLEDQFTTLETYVGETENYIAARELRATTENNISYIKTCIRQANKMYSKIQEDDFESLATESLAGYIEWLQGELDDLVSGDTTDGSLAALEEEKAELEEDFISELQENDFDGAAAVALAIDAVDEEIAEAEEDLDSDDAEDAAELNNSSTLSGAVSSLTSQAIEDITDGSSESTALNALVYLGAEDAIAEIEETLGDNEDLEEALLSAENLFNQNATSEDKNNQLVGEGSSGKYLEDSLLTGTTFEKVATLAALSTLEEDSYVNLEEFKNRLLNDVKYSKYMYTTYVSSGGETFVSLFTIGELTEYRYVFDGTIRPKAKMQGMTRTYIFTNNSTTVTIPGEDDTKTKRFRIQENPVLEKSTDGNWMYLSNTDSLNIFDIKGFVITDDYSVAADAKVRAREEEILEEIADTE